MGSSVNSSFQSKKAGSESLLSSDTRATLDKMRPEISEFMDNYLVKSKFDVWRNSSIELRLVRVICGNAATSAFDYPVYHWGTCIGSEESGWIIVNRDLGLDIDFRHQFCQAVAVVK